MSTPPTTIDDDPASPTANRANRGAASVSYAGLVFIAFSPIIFSIAAYCLFKAVPLRRMSIPEFAPELILCGIGAFSALLGVSLLRAGGLASTQPNRVINRAEWDTICEQVKEGHEDPITQYIRLTSLTGFTGMFTKLGLSGLPLATIALTIFFSLLFFQSDQFLDLAKLTLGAFIGSFVQRQIGAQGGGSVKLPTGEKVSVSPSDPLY